jgi:hypothetical protein
MNSVEICPRQLFRPCCVVAQETAHDLLPRLELFFVPVAVPFARAGATNGYWMPRP